MIRSEIRLVSVSCLLLSGVAGGCSVAENPGSGNGRSAATPAGGSSASAGSGSASAGAGTGGLPSGGASQILGGAGGASGTAANVAGAGAGGVSSGGASGGSGAGGGTTSDRSADGTCTRWKADTANLDEGTLWPVAFALKELTAADEAKIGALVKQAAN